jgi:hypothetical protein
MQACGDAEVDGGKVLGEVGFRVLDEVWELSWVGEFDGGVDVLDVAVGPVFAEVTVYSTDFPEARSLIRLRITRSPKAPL